MAEQTTYTFKQPVRAPFLTLYEPRQFKGKGDYKYSATLLIPKDSPDVAGVKAAMTSAANEKWPGRALSELKFPLASGEKAAEKAKAKGKDGSFNLGHLVLTSRSKFPPVLSVLAPGKIITLDSDMLKAQYKPKFYGGCFVGAMINFVPYSMDDKDGITAYLQSVLWVKEGERIGGRDQAEVFKDYMGHATDVDPVGDDQDDEIPF